MSLKIYLMSMNFTENVVYASESWKIQRQFRNETKPEATSEFLSLPTKLRNFMGFYIVSE